MPQLRQKTIIILERSLMPLPLQPLLTTRGHHHFHFYLHRLVSSVLELHVIGSQ